MCYFKFTIPLIIFIADTEIWEVENEGRMNDFRLSLSRAISRFSSH